MDQLVCDVDGDAWVQHTSFVEDNSPVTCIEYDNCFDLLWQGQANGRLSCYSFADDAQYFDASDPEASYIPIPPDMTRFSSFPVVADGIVQLLPNQASIVAVSCSKIRLLTHGGSGLGSWSLNHCPSPTMIAGAYPMLSSSDTAFTCADLIRDPTVSRTSSSYVATSLIAATSTNAAYLFDLTQGMDSPVMVYNVSQPTVKIQSNGHLMVAAGQDGAYNQQLSPRWPFHLPTHSVFISSFFVALQAACACSTENSARAR